MASTLLLYTQNITRHSIAWRPPQGPSSSGENSNTELLHAIHSSLHYALDPCQDHPDEPCSFSFAGPHVGASGVDGIVKDAELGKLVVPRETDLRRTKDNDGEVTLKMFFFEPPSLQRASKGKERERIREMWVNEALEALEKATGKKEVFRFVVKLDDVKWDGRPENEETGMDDIDSVGPLWQYLSKNVRIRNIGVSDFSAKQLSRLYSVLAELPPLDVKPPSSDHLNLFDCDAPPCLNPPDDLQNVAAKKAVELVAHSDEHDILPVKALTSLLTEFQDRLPLPESFEKWRDAGEVKKAVAGRWVLKYTVVIRSRGILVDKGYIVSAEFPQ